MTLYQLHLDVPGELGEQTVWESPTPAHPHGPCGVVFVHLELHDWRGDCAVEASPAYMVTADLLGAIRANNLTGAAVQEMETTLGEPYAYSGSPPPESLPKLHRLLPEGRVRADDRKPIVYEWSGHDFSEGNTGLVVSERALELLRSFGLKHATVRPVSFQGGT